MLGTLRAVAHPQARRETRMSIAESPHGPPADPDAPPPIAAPETSTHPFLVRRAAVLGAGTMGSRIAAHLANAGIPSFLLDLVPEGAGAQRNTLAMKAIDALGKSKPAAFYEPGLPPSSPPATSKTTSPSWANAIG